MRRDDCLECGAPLPPGQRKFCSKKCLASLWSRRNYERRATIKVVGKRACVVCGKRGRFNRFCSDGCLTSWRKLRKGRKCPECGADLPPGAMPLVIFCSVKCRGAKTSRAYYHKKSEEDPGFLEKHRVRIGRLRSKRLRHGLCAQCSTPIEDGRRYCVTCRERNTMWHRVSGKSSRK